MKSDLKIILSFLIGILFSGITVYAATTYLSRDVSFTPSDENWKVSNVEDALNDLYEKASLNTEENKFYISNLGVYIHDSKGGKGGFKFDAQNYKTLTVGSRTRGGVIGTTYWQIVGYSEADCTGTETNLLYTTTPSSDVETYDISEYKCIFLQAICTSTGSSNAWKYYNFNDITLLK